jgi:hypothetical protein
MKYKFTQHKQLTAPKIYLVILCCNFFYAAFAQDTLPVKKHRTTIYPTTDFDQRFSFVAKEDANIWGYRVGLLVNEKFKVGIGGYFLNQDTSVVSYLPNGNPRAKLQRNLYFGTIYYEPFLFRKQVIEMSLVFEAGYGKATLDSNVRSQQGTRVTYKDVQVSQAFVPVGVGISYNFKFPDIKPIHFLTYIGINALVGLRKTLLESDLKYNYDGWYWSIGGAIFIDKMFADMHKAKLRKQAATEAAGLKPVN